MTPTCTELEQFRHKQAFSSSGAIRAACRRCCENILLKDGYYACSCGKCHPYCVRCWSALKRQEALTEFLMDLPAAEEDAVCVTCGDEADSRYCGRDYCESPCLERIFEQVCVQCTNCGAEPGHPCLTLGGRAHTTVHVWRQQLADAFVVYPHCGAKPGEACLSSTGLEKQYMHARRLRAAARKSQHDDVSLQVASFEGILPRQTSFFRTLRLGSRSGSVTASSSCS